MLTVILITLRETMEMLLVILALVAYVAKVNKKDLLKYIISGSITGLGVSAVCGFLIFNQVGKLEGTSRDIFLGAIMILIALFILYYMVWMRKQKQFLGANIDEKYNIKSTAAGFFVFSFITIFRESIEIIMFILPMFNTSVTTIVTGSVIGAGISILICYLIYGTALKLDINIIFSAITLLLIFLGSEMFAEGVVGLVPSLGSSGETAARLIYAVPTLFLFIKGITGDYLKKKK